MATTTATRLHRPDFPDPARSLMMSRDSPESLGDLQGPERPPEAATLFRSQRSRKKRSPPTRMPRIAAPALRAHRHTALIPLAP